MDFSTAILTGPGERLSTNSYEVHLAELAHLKFTAENTENRRICYNLEGIQHFHNPD